MPDNRITVILKSDASSESLDFNVFTTLSRLVRFRGKPDIFLKIKDFGKVVKQVSNNR